MYRHGVESPPQPRERSSLSGHRRVAVVIYIVVVDFHRVVVAYEYSKAWS